VVLAIPIVRTGKVVVSQGAALIQQYQFGWLRRSPGPTLPPNRDFWNGV
jgi:hypothetical protein